MAEAMKLSREDLDLFRDAVRGVRPISAKPRAPSASDHAPILPVQSLLDDHDALRESVMPGFSPEHSMETGEELVFLRPGLTQEVLKKLRRGHWVAQDEIDLHGLNREQARQMLAQFMNKSARRGLRCVRVVHGKGLRSPKREPVLKAKVQSWLSRRIEVLAFCQAPENRGGSGALLVLLKG